MKMTVNAMRHEVDRLESDEEAEAWMQSVRNEGWLEGRSEGRAEGWTAGQHALLRRLAISKYGVKAGTRIASQLEGITEHEMFDEALAAIIEHDTPAVPLEYAADAQIRSLSKAFAVWLSARMERASRMER